MKKIKVLIIDDSALVRQTLTEILKSDREIEVIGVASDPYIAVKKIRKNVPDVITLDIEMPRMDGLTFLKKLMSQAPIPVVIISSITEQSTASAIMALEYGAVEVVSKPKLNTKELLNQARKDLCTKVKAAAEAKVKRLATGIKLAAPQKLSADVIIQRSSPLRNLHTTEKIIAVGASTGGTEAIKEFLFGLPIDSPGIVIVQHMPELFTRQFAKRLNDCCGLSVKEASHGDPVFRGQVLIAPGAKHMLLQRSGANYYVDIKDGPLVNRHKPSVDVLFRSAAKSAGKNAIGIILTGMGDDGAQGLLEMKLAGAITIAQDETSSIVFGMPKAAIQLGAVEKVLPLCKIPENINQYKNDLAFK